MKDPDLYQTIGRRIRSRRRLLGLTQTQVAEACGVTFQQVQKYESGASAFSVSRLVKLAQALQLPPSDLVGPVTDFG
ncbi:helix-turn-helix domain-containing protein [Phenylobacterium sp.]|uniref:helix-turn-helix domain-containing protein n=1 Tax=Phenylobacterium sp. TaxID=1871053 RepID=UPI0035642CDF